MVALPCCWTCHPADSTICGRRAHIVAARSVRRIVPMVNRRAVRAKKACGKRMVSDEPQKEKRIQKMKTILILVGKTADKHFQAGISDYAERISHYMPGESLTIPELHNTKHHSEKQHSTADGQRTTRQIQTSDTVVLLDEHGKEMTSVQYARWLQQRSMNSRRLVFVIGGPYGFSPAVYSRADEKISLSLMTFSHQMVRLIFTEQLYRACTIIKGEPYHHE